LLSARALVRAPPFPAARVRSWPLVVAFRVLDEPLSRLVLRRVEAAFFLLRPVCVSPAVVVIATSSGKPRKIRRLRLAVMRQKSLWQRLSSNSGQVCTPMDSRVEPWPADPER
jgi:hypothetical protein